MPQKLYTAKDMGTGLPIVNSPDPTGLQDVATKNYVDTNGYPRRFPLYQTIWEDEYSMQCSSFSCTNGYTHMTTGPIDRSYTKLYPDTGIAVTGTMTFYINVSSAQIKLVPALQGQPGIEICGLWAGPTGEHQAFPVGWRPFGSSYFVPTTFTGSFTLAWYVYVSNATTTFQTDASDAAAWTVSEIRPGT